MGNAYARIKPSDAEPDALRSAGPRVLQYTSALGALRISTRFLVGCRTSSAGLGGVAAVGGFDIDGEIELHHHVSTLVGKKRGFEDGVAVIIANHPISALAGNGKELAKPVMLGMVAIG